MARLGLTVCADEATLEVVEVVVIKPVPVAIDTVLETVADDEGRPEPATPGVGIPWRARAGTPASEQVRWKKALELMSWSVLWCDQRRS